MRRFPFSDPNEWLITVLPLRIRFCNVLVYKSPLVSNAYIEVAILYKYNNCITIIMSTWDWQNLCLSPKVRLYTAMNGTIYDLDA